MKPNTAIILSLVCELGNVSGKVFEDGKPTLSDTAHLLALTDEIYALKDLEFSTLLPDLRAAMSPSEWSETMQTLAAKFDIPQDEIEAKIEASLGSVGMIVSGILGLAKAWLPKK